MFLLESGGAVIIVEYLNNEGMSTELFHVVHLALDDPLGPSGVNHDSLHCHHASSLGVQGFMDISHTAFAEVVKSSIATFSPVSRLTADEGVFWR